MDLWNVCINDKNNKEKLLQFFDQFSNCFPPTTHLKYNLINIKVRFSLKPNFRIYIFIHLQ